MMNCSTKLILLLQLTVVIGHEININPEALMEQAEIEINAENQELMKMGAKTRRFIHNKFTPE